MTRIAMCFRCEKRQIESDVCNRCGVSLRPAELVEKFVEVERIVEVPRVVYVPAPPVVVFASARIDGTVPSQPTLAEVERATIISTLVMFGGQKLKAAAALGISKTTLYRKIGEYEIEAGKEQPGETL